ncbi:hypothetical protein [Amycolatopsis anabasis]|uniref:hypothetical protein n=1 Tax=Amycolatopsis anabasis TaxID=1840409 RepID=UPI00131C780C|nr:hypothetical protein [Amycolatopsis anabasis]
MANALSDVADLAVNPTFMRKVQAAAVRTARNISSEDQTGMDPVRAGQRRDLARQVLQDSTHWAGAFAFAIAADATTSTASTDAVIMTQVAAVWDGMIGAQSSPPAE